MSAKLTSSLDKNCHDLAIKGTYRERPAIAVQYRALGFRASFQLIGVQGIIVLNFEDSLGTKSEIVTDDVFHKLFQPSDPEQMKTLPTIDCPFVTDVSDDF